MNSSEKILDHQFRLYKIVDDNFWEQTDGLELWILQGDRDDAQEITAFLKIYI